VDTVVVTENGTKNSTLEQSKNIPNGGDIKARLMTRNKIKIERYNEKLTIVYVTISIRILYRSEFLSL
jgi:hypothetical protein